MNKIRESSITVYLMIFVLLSMILTSVPVLANGLDGISGGVESGVSVEQETPTPTPTPTPAPTPAPTPTPTPEVQMPEFPKADEEQAIRNENTANAIGGLFSGIGIDESSVAAASQFTAPAMVILNKVMAVVLGIAAGGMALVTVLDLLYMAVPPVRDLLDGGQMGQQQNQQGGMQGGMGGMGGMSGGYGGMSGGYGGRSNSRMGGMQGGQQQPHGGGLSAVGRWVSDEAIASCMETQGGGGMQGGRVKSLMGTYMRKRSMFLIMFGICVVLFSTTVFTDLGIRIGTWILRILSGVGV